MNDHSNNHESHEQDLTKGPIGKQLWSLAWPMMLSVFFYTLYNLVDTYWVSKLAAEAIAAVSISQITLFVMIALSMGLAVGSAVVMSMHIGAKNNKEAERVLGQSLVLSAIAGVFFTVISLLFRKELLLVSGATGAIFDPALEYFTITAAGSILYFLMMAIMMAFNSEGDTFTLTKMFAVSTLINLILDPILIFGWGVIPPLGVSGAAIATLISQMVFIVIALRELSGEHRKIRFRFSNLSAQWESVKKVVDIGIPASLTQVINPVGTAVLLYIISDKFLEAGVVAFSLGFRVEFFAFLPAVGFGFGAMAMIGQNMGAGNPDRAKKSFNIALKYGFLAAVGLGILAIIFAKYIIGVFTTEPLVVDYALKYLWVVALTYGFLSAGMVEASAFQAMGRSWPGFWIFFIRFFVISIPLAYVLVNVYDFDIIAVWTSIAIGNFVSAIIGYFWIKRVMERKDFTESVPLH